MNYDRPGYANEPDYGAQQPQQGYQQTPPGYVQGFGHQPGQANQPEYTAAYYGYQPQQGGYMQPQGGYAQPQAAYQQTGYVQPQGGYQQTGYGQSQAGYQQAGYGQPQGGYQQAGYGQPQAGYQQAGYGQPQAGYQQTGYGQYQGGYQQGGYVQPQQPAYGNYVQQQAQQPKKPFDVDVIFQILLYGVLPVMFALSMIFRVTPLKWVFVGLAAVMIGVLMLRNFTSRNMKITLSAVYAALAVVALVSALTGSAPLDNTDSRGSGGVVPPPSLSGGSQTAAQTGSSNPFDQGDTQGNMGALEDVADPAPSATPDPSDMADSETLNQLESFLYFWQSNQQDEMVNRCAPSWRSDVEDPRKELFRILANRRLMDYQTEKITGTANDTTRNVSATVTIMRGEKTQRYRMQIVMLKENDAWYVDPRSLSTLEPEETPTPTPSTTATPDPNANVTSSTKLYYNPDGGARYHADAYCKSAHEKHLPFKGTFTYGQVNDAKFAELLPCNVCNAPLRQ